MSRWSWGSAWPAPAKLNLFLHVVGRRPDGYHLLQTVFRFIDRFTRETNNRKRVESTRDVCFDSDNSAAKYLGLNGADSGY